MRMDSKTTTTTTQNERTQFDRRGGWSLGPWNFYFVLKLILFWRGAIGFHPWLNLAFLIALAIPVRNQVLRYLRALAAVPVGIALFYHDSWLPPAKRIIEQANSLSQFTFGYVIELLGRFIHWEQVAAIVALWALYRFASKFLKLGVFMASALIVLALVQVVGNRLNTEQNPGGAVAATLSEASMLAGGTLKLSDLNYWVNKFFSEESLRRIVFGAEPKENKPFDIVFVHICSLSWSDLKAMHLENHPVWQTMDMVFTRFNSAASYSGPAAIRLLRTPCGQLPHVGLYNPAQPDCYLMNSLERVGYEKNLVMNHDGHFEGFLKTVQQQGLQQQPMRFEGLSPDQHAFDDSPIYNDNQILNDWSNQRARDPARQVALYYNTISLHDGNHVVGPDSGLPSIKTYGLRLKRLLDGLAGFEETLQNSGRNTLLVIVPEHGAAIRGDKFQIAGLREIPTPSITLVPVGIKFISAQPVKHNRRSEESTPEGQPGTVGSKMISMPTSYLALAQVITNALQGSATPQELANNLPLTPFVAQNSNNMMVGDSTGYFLKQDENPAWEPYDTTEN